MNHRKSSAIKIALSIGLLSFQVSALAAEPPELKAFPPAKEGMTRFVIVLPHKERDEEDAFKLELVAGKSMPTDGVNLMRIASAVEPRNVQGWGYTYYEVTGSGVAISTMMAAPEGGKTVERFVAGTPLVIRYNSRLPVVIYAPDDQEVRYRLWEASKTFQAAEKK